MAYRPSSDKILLLVVGILTIFGLLMVYSTSVHIALDNGKPSYYFFLRQLIFAVIGFVLLLFLMRVDYHFFQRRHTVWGMLGIGALALIVVLGQAGPAGKENIHRWINLGVISLQPSEFTKLALVIFVAWFLQQYEKYINQLEKLGVCFAVIAVYAALILLEPDFGQAAAIVIISVILLIIAGLHWRYLFGVALAALPIFYFAVYRIDYRWKRVKVFLDPGSEPYGAGYQPLQALVAVGNGGIFGQGLGDSSQKMFFLTEADTDFIFAVICEELGVIVASLLVAAFLFFFFRGMKIAFNSHDRFGFYLGVGLTLMVVLQGFISMSMVLGLLPTKGIALPFISRGGSSILLNLAATGILLNLSYQNKVAETEN